MGENAVGEVIVVDDGSTDGSAVVYNRPQDLHAVSRKIRALQTAFTTPAFIILALIGLLYDPRYAVSGTFLSILALNGAVGVLPMVYQNVFLSMGNSRIHAVVMGASSALKILGTVIGFYMGGPIGMIVGAGVANVFVFVIFFYLAWKRDFPPCGSISP